MRYACDEVLIVVKQRKHHELQQVVLNEREMKEKLQLSQERIYFYDEQSKMRPAIWR